MFCKKILIKKKIIKKSLLFSHYIKRINMKKIFLFLGSILTLAITSCNKCYECDFNSISTEYCQDEYSNDELDNLETTCENLGGDWHLSLD